MTAIVGVLCRDGVVIGTDSSATFSAGQMRTIEQPTEKLDIIADRVIVAGTGAIGLGQRFKAVVQAGWSGKLFTQPPVEIGKALSAGALQDFAQTGMKSGSFGALVAFSTSKEPQLCELDVAQFQPELKTERLWYVSLGSSQPITDPFLALMREVFWQDGQPTVRDAVFVVAWALDHAIACNPGGVNAPARIAVLEKSGGDYVARLVDDFELEEHRQAIEAAKTRLRDFPSELQSGDTGDAEVPDVPTPDETK